MRYLREWSAARLPLAPLIDSSVESANSGRPRPKLAGRDFLIPWNVTKEFWQLYDKPPAERPLYPFSAEPVEEFVKSYAGKREVPIFESKLIAPVIYINDLPELLKDGSAFRRYLAETHSPFAILINSGTANFSSDADPQAPWRLLNVELRDQFLGSIFGDSIGLICAQATQYLKVLA